MTNQSMKEKQEHPHRDSSESEKKSPKIPQNILCCDKFNIFLAVVP
jgi:hypothetical protein